MRRRWTETSVILGIINHSELDRRVVYNFKRSNKESCKKIHQINDLTDEERDCVNNGNWTEWSAIWSEIIRVIWNHKYAWPKIAWPEVQYPLYYFNLSIFLIDLLKDAISSKK